MDNLLQNKAKPDSANLDNIVTKHYEDNENALTKAFGKSVFAMFFGGIAVWILDSVQVIIIALMVFIVFHLFIISPHTIEGPSMEPNFCNGDLAIVDKLTPRFNPYKKGDVIIFKKTPTEDYIKRIIAVGGDKIRIESGDVFVNGNEIDESYLPQSRMTRITSSSIIDEGSEYTVPEGQYFVMGDNRDHSIDSRSFRFIDPAQNIIKGRVIALVWPLEDSRIFNNAEARPENVCDL
jgi:signal peptidase I